MRHAGSVQGARLVLLCVSCGHAGDGYDKPALQAAAEPLHILLVRGMQRENSEPDHVDTTECMSTVLRDALHVDK